MLFYQSVPRSTLALEAERFHRRVYIKYCISSICCFVWNLTYFKYIFGLLQEMSSSAAQMHFNSIDWKIMENNWEYFANWMLCHGIECFSCRAHCISCCKAHKSVTYRFEACPADHQGQLSQDEKLPLQHWWGGHLGALDPWIRRCPLEHDIFLCKLDLITDWVWATLRITHFHIMMFILQNWSNGRLNHARADHIKINTTSSSRSVFSIDLPAN